MNVTVYPSKLIGEVKAIPSKSMAHRLLICAAMSEGVTRVRCSESSQDIEATIACLKAMGSNIVKIGNMYLVPKVTVHAGQSVTLDCNESGTTLRLMMCVAAGLGLCARFKGCDRLFERPLEPLAQVLTDHGIVISRDADNRIIQSGRAFGYDYEITGEVSSQFISGLLLMLPLCGGGNLTVTGNFESKPYVDLTVKALLDSDVSVSEEGRSYTVRGRYDLRDTLVEGDWSNAAFFLAAGALGGNVKVNCLDAESAQGDKEILSLLCDFGAEIQKEKNKVSCKGRELCAQKIDVSNIPDLVPVLAVIASGAKGTTSITGAKRLRLKESDRLRTVSEMINNLGGRCFEKEDSLIIEGAGVLTGGEVDACNDHRIAMSAAIAACICEHPVVIKGAQAVEKSYPGFFEDLQSLGVHTLVEE